MYFNHDTGNGFDGSNIVASYKTPDMDYGDAGIRKTLYYVKTSIRSEGTNNNLKIQCRYDFESNAVAQPDEISNWSITNSINFWNRYSFWFSNFWWNIISTTKNNINR